MLEYIYPIKTGKTIFDVWFPIHVAFWIYFGSGLWSFKLSKTCAVIISLVLAICWELFERFAEKRWPHLWLNQESVWNAYVGDQISVFVGVLLAYYMLNNWR